MAFPQITKIKFFQKKTDSNRLLPAWLENAVKEKKDVLNLLHDIQQNEGFISRKRIEFIAKEYSLPLSHLYSVVSFYTAFKTKKQGKHIIKVCSGTACNVKKNSINLNYLEKALGIKVGQTSVDGLFSLEKVNCLGTCSLAPVVEIDGRIHSLPQVEDLAKIIQKIKREEE